MFYRLFESIKLKRIKRNIKYTYQIWTRGYCDSDTWALGDNIIKYTLPRLIILRNNFYSFPSCFSKAEEWEEILDKIIYSFTICNKIQDDCTFWENFIIEKAKKENPKIQTKLFDKTFKKYSEKEWETIKEGLKLFGEYLINLWD